MTAWRKGRWWCRDCLVLFRGGTGMAQRFSAWPPRDKPLPERQACAITVLAGGPETPIQPQRMYNKIQAAPAGKLHTGSTSKRMNRIFSNILKKCYYMLKPENINLNVKRKPCFVSTGVYHHMSHTVNLRSQHHTPEFPSSWDNLNDNVICHFVHKVIYPLYQMELWGVGWVKVIGSTDEFTELGWWHEPFQCAAIPDSQQEKVKIFPFKGLNQA